MNEIQNNSPDRSDCWFNYVFTALMFAIIIALYSFQFINGGLEFREPLAVNLAFIAFVLYVTGVIVAWFKIKIGAILITVCAIAQMILFHEPNDPVLTLLQILLIPVGPLLVYLSFGKRLTESKK